MGPCSRSVLITFTVRVTKQHPLNISTSVPVFYRIIKICVLVRVRVIKALVIAHSCFNSYAHELVPIFYSAIKHGYRCFIS